MARPPLHLMTYDLQCDCGRWLSGRIILEEETDSILAESSCPCGRKTNKVVGYLVAIQCRKCKTIVKL
jgi:hypothetical protein